MIKRLKYIFIPVLAILLMSHNVFAVDTVLDLSNYTATQVMSRSNVDCNINGTNYTNQEFCVTTTDVYNNILSINTRQIIEFQKDDIFEMDLVAFTPGDDILENIDFSIINFQIEGSNYSLISFKDVSNTLYGNYMHGLSGLSGGSTISKVIRFTFKINNNYSGRVGFKTSFSTYPIFSINGKMQLKFINGIIYRKTDLNSTNEEQKEATQDAADNSSTAGDSSTSDSTSATNSLLSVIGAGIGAITSASPTNCKINGNMGNLDIGNIDLCANPVPAFIAVIGSIIAVLVVLPLVIVLFNRFISIIRSFQG